MMKPSRDEPASFPASSLYAYLSISAVISLAIWVLLLLPNFLAGRGWSSQAIGWAMGIYFFVNLVGQVLSGQLAAHYGGIRTALWGAATSVAGGVFYILAPHLPALIFAARALHGAGAALIYGGALIALLEAVPPGLRGRMIGYFGLPGFVMLGVGPPLAEWFVYRWGFEGVFALVPAMFVAVAVILALMPRPFSQGRRSVAPLSSALSESAASLGPILTLSVLFGFSFSAWNSFIAPAVGGVGPGAVSMFSLGYGLGAVATRLGLSHQVEVEPLRRLAISALVPYGAAIGFIPHAGSIWQLVVLGLVCGAIHGTYFPSLSAIAAERFPEVHATQATVLYISANALGLFLGPPLWGILADRVGYRWTFGLSGLVLAAATVWFVWGQSRRRAEDAGGLRAVE